MITWLKEIGRDVLGAAYVVQRSLFSTFFFNVKWLSSCGTLFVLLLAFILLIVLLTCLVLGGVVSPQSFKKQS